MKVYGTHVIAVIEILAGADLVISNICAYFLAVNLQILSLAAIIGIIYIVAG